MVQKQKRGIVLILAGLCLLVVSFPFVSGYSNGGVMGYLRHGELVFKEGYSTQEEIAFLMSLAEPAPAPRPFNDPAPVQLSYKEKRINEIKAKARPDEIRISMRYKYFFAFDVIVIFIGIWLVVTYRIEKGASAPVKG